MNTEQKDGAITFGRYLFLSILIHFCIFFVIAFFLSMLGVNKLVNRTIIEIIQTESASENLAEEIPTDEEEISEVEEEVEPEKEMPKEESVYYDISKTDADTSGLEQVYSESTLNVRLKYPRGWTFIDQNVKKKLDGITFWMTDGVYSPPPYVHLEVKEKYLFNESRFKFSFEMDGSTAYYNDPEELEKQVSQIIYIRTESDEDFSLKLIMTGRDDFKKFQPVFFGMIKSFKFGKSLF